MTGLSDPLCSRQVNFNYVSSAFVTTSHRLQFMTHDSPLLKITTTRIQSSLQPQIHTPLQSIRTLHREPHTQRISIYHATSLPISCRSIDFIYDWPIRRNCSRSLQCTYILYFGRHFTRHQVGSTPPTPTRDLLTLYKSTRPNHLVHTRTIPLPRYSGVAKQR